MLSNNSIKLLYGKNGLLLNIEDNWKPDIIRKPIMPIIDNIPEKIKEIFNKPINAENLQELCKNAKTACILVCDITRPVPNHLFIEHMIKEMHKAGIKLENILIIIATGLHRPAPEKEIKEIIKSKWVLNNIKIVNHYARDDNNHQKIGVTSKGNVIKLDKRFLDSDIKIATGLVEPHFMAGYSGGRKVLAPGIAHAETITTFHSARYMENKYSTSCNLTSNPLHEDQLEIVKMIGDVYAVNCVIDENRKLSYINFGEIISSHLKAVKYISSYAKVKCGKEFSTIITTAAGAPLDSNFYQTIKGMVTPLSILKEGGDLIIVAECSEGLGSDDFLKSQKNLLKVGLDKFLEQILNKEHADIDEWQTEMEVKSLKKGNIYLYSEGLSNADKKLTGVNITNNLIKTVNKSIEKHNNYNVAIIPEGPYVIPVV